MYSLNLEKVDRDILKNSHKYLKLPRLNLQGMSTNVDSLDDPQKSSNDQITVDIIHQTVPPKELEPLKESLMEQAS